MSEMRGYAAAQRAYDNMSPPEDGPCECGECGGCGKVPDADDLDGDLIPCPWCEGTGRVDEDGNPWAEAPEYEGD